MISSEDIAYLAGLFDGEGSIYFAKRIEKKKKHILTSEETSMLMEKNTGLRDGRKVPSQE